jgi:trk system potassium uptake protein TrkA
MSVSHYREQYLQVIIAGGGRVGQESAMLMTGYGHRATIIEQDPRIVRAHSQDRDDITFVVGNASERDTLVAAGIRDADIVLALTDDEATNVRICQQATRLTSDVRCVARSHRSPPTPTRSRRLFFRSAPGHGSRSAGRLRLRFNP